MTSWVGRGMEVTAGRKLGYAFHQERAEIRRHLTRRYAERGWLVNAFVIEFRINRIQERIHRNRPTYAERSRSRTVVTGAATVVTSFTAEELAHLVALFNGSNDPLSAAIREKAVQLLGEG